MGQWHISIEGEGSHHNQNNPGDANRLAAEFIERLKKAGQSVTKASFTSGARDDLDPQQGSALKE